MIDDVFAVIADPTRRQILRVLSSGKRPVGDLVNELGVSQPTVSKHLKVLRTAGLVETQAVGQKRFYSLTPEPLTQISAWVESLNQALEQTANSPLSAEETPASHQPQQQEESYPQPQEVLEPAVATFNLGQEGGSTAPGQPRHSQRAIAFTPLKPFVPKITAAEMTVESEQVTVSEQIAEEAAVTNDAVETTEERATLEESTLVEDSVLVEDSGPIEDSDLVEEPVSVEKSEPAEDDSATQHAEPEEATPAPEQHAYEPLPALPTAPGREQESDQRGLLATLSRWGRRRSR